jgi:hypothetical protein
MSAVHAWESAPQMLLQLKAILFSLTMRRVSPALHAFRFVLPALSVRSNLNHEDKAGIAPEKQ